MKKNIDPQTAKLFEAARAAYIDNYSVGVIKSPIAKNVTAAEVGRFLAWHVEDNELYNRVQRIRGNEIEHGNLSPMEKSTLAECHRRRRAISNNMTKCGFQLFIQDEKKVIQLIEGYQCGIMALPRIYAELCRLVGEKPIELAAWPNNEATAPAEDAAPRYLPAPVEIYQQIDNIITSAVPAPQLPEPPAVVYVFEPCPPTPSTLTDADVLAQAERIKAIYEDMKAEAVEGMKADDLPDTTPIYTAADVERMIEEATADTYTAEEVAAMVAAAVAEERARYTRRRFAPRLRPVLRRLGRVAAVVLPLLIVAIFIGASTASAPATDAAAVTICQAAETVAQVAELPAVTVTASSLTTAPAAPSPVKKLAAPSPVKKTAADAVTLPNQKTASDIATATAPAAADADSLTTAPAAPLAPAADADGLTICAGTAWAYTMMQWA